MNDNLELLATGALIGIGGSLLIDAWSLVLRRVFGVTTLDYAMLGRWIGHFRRGQFAHKRIGAAEPVRGEQLLGWAAHYGIGIAFAFLLLAIAGRSWAETPTIAPALLVGFATVLAPWLVMQPAFGAGIAGSKSANPRAGRLRNLGTHFVYGVGLYGSAVLLSLL